MIVSVVIAGLEPPEGPDRCLCWHQDLFDLSDVLFSSEPSLPAGRRSGGGSADSSHQCSVGAGAGCVGSALHERGRTTAAPAHALFAKQHCEGQHGHPEALQAAGTDHL